MSHTITTALICAYALLVNIVAIPAPPRRSDNKETETMSQERTIVIRRLSNAYLYPFSLWPLPKYPISEERSAEYAYNGKNLRKIKKEKNNEWV